MFFNKLLIDVIFLHNFSSASFGEMNKMPSFIKNALFLQLPDKGFVKTKIIELIITMELNEDMK